MSSDRPSLHGCFLYLDEIIWHQRGYDHENFHEGFVDLYVSIVSFGQDREAKPSVKAFEQ